MGLGTQYPYWCRMLGLLTSGSLGLQALNSGYSGHTVPAEAMSPHGSEGIFEAFQPCLGSLLQGSLPVRAFILLQPWPSERPLSSCDLLPRSQGEHGSFHPPIRPPPLIHIHATCLLWFRCETTPRDSHTGGLLPQQYSEVISMGG